MARLLYSVLYWLLLPVILGRLWWKGRHQPGYRQHWLERLGRYNNPVHQPVLWLHAVSVGETRAAQPLIQRLQQDYPHAHIVLTHTTPTGRATSEQLFGQRVTRVYLPYDLAPALHGFLNHFRPQLGILMETEIWPNLNAACRAHGLPLLLANARLSARSARRYARFSSLSREALSAFSLVAAQSPADGERLQRLGAPAVQVVGNIKFDVEPPAPLLALGQTLRAWIGPRPVLLAASTREGEEDLLLAALRAQPLPDNGLLLLVPRHPERFESVAQSVLAQGLRLQKRSAQGPVAAETQVLLGDSMGEMFAYYSACDLAYIGGSLLPLGGQNLIEACAVAKPVLVGPHTFNFTEATDNAIAAGAALRVDSAPALLQHACALLQDAHTRQHMGQAALTFAQQHRGATARTMDLVRGLFLSEDIGDTAHETKQ